MTIERDGSDPLIMALPNGRILGEVMPLLRRIGIEPEPAFDDPASRQLRFRTSDPGLDLIRVRSFDAATFVAFGAAQLGVAGNDVLMEFDYSEIYALLDLGVGHCRLAVAATTDALGQADIGRASHVRVATKYPEVTRRHFAARGIQAECIKLNGAVELAPRLGLCHHIVDLVQTGATLEANGLIEVEPIAEVSSRLIVNRPALKTRPEEVGAWIERFRAAVNGKPSPTQPLGLAPPSPAVPGRVKEVGAPILSRTAGEDAERSEAGEGRGL
jgi:ATP phosphoribosyltransferase